MTYKFKVKFEGKNEVVSFPEDPDFDNCATVQDLKRHLAEVFGIVEGKCKLLKFKHESGKLLKDCKLSKTTRITLVGPKVEEAIKVNKQTQQCLWHRQVEEKNFRDVGILLTSKAKFHVSFNVPQWKLDMQGFHEGRLAENLKSHHQERAEITFKLKKAALRPVKYKLTRSERYGLLHWFFEGSSDNKHWHILDIQSTTNTSKSMFQLKENSNYYTQFRIRQTGPNQEYNNSLFSVKFSDPENCSFSCTTSPQNDIIVNRVFDQGLIDIGVVPGLKIMYLVDQKGKWLDVRRLNHVNDFMSLFVLSRYFANEDTPHVHTSQNYVYADAPKNIIGGKPYNPKTVVFQRDLGENRLDEHVLCINQLELYGDFIETEDVLNDNEILINWIQSFVESLIDQYDACMDKYQRYFEQTMDPQKLAYEIHDYILKHFGDTPSKVLQTTSFATLYRECTEKFRHTLTGCERHVMQCLYQWEVQWNDLEWPKATYEIICEYLEYFSVEPGVYGLKMLSLPQLVWDGTFLRTSVGEIRFQDSPAVNPNFLSVGIPILNYASTGFLFAPNTRVRKRLYDSPTGARLYEFIRETYRTLEIKKHTFHPHILRIEDDVSIQASSAWEDVTYVTTKLQKLEIEVPPLFKDVKLRDQVRVTDRSFMVDSQVLKKQLKVFKQPCPAKSHHVDRWKGKVVACVVHPKYHFLVYKVQIQGYREVLLDCRAFEVDREMEVEKKDSIEKMEEDEQIENVQGADPLFFINSPIQL